MARMTQVQVWERRVKVANTQARNARKTKTSPLLSGNWETYAETREFQAKNCVAMLAHIRAGGTEASYEVPEEQREMFAIHIYGIKARHTYDEWTP